MIPLLAMPPEQAARIAHLLFDLDDTLLTHGRLTREAYDALCDLADAGISLLAVTGRPAGWGEVIARQWPIEGVVAENGAVLLWREGSRVVRSLRGTSEERARDRDRLRALADRVFDAVPSLAATDDEWARATDATFDIGENVRVPPEDVDRARAIIRAAGARAIASSIHLHASFEGDDKASGVFRFFAERRGIDPAVARARSAFVGDSENDAACFAAFPVSIGVANVAASVGRLSVPPRYVTRGAMGAGFAEVAAYLVGGRGRAGPQPARAVVSE